MVCDTPEGITLSFPKHGIEVFPNESDLRSQKRNYSRGQFKLPEAAANLVSEEVDDWTVAFVKIHGNIARRMVVPHDAMEFRHDLNDKTIGVLDLHDPRNILDRTEINRTFDGKEVSYVVDRILDRRQDEDGVISGYSIMGEDAQEWQTSEVVEYNTTTGDFGRWVDDQIANITGIDLSMDNNGGLDLSGSLTEAMNQLADEFEADWWVGTDGTLYFGIREALGDVYEVGGVASDVVMSRYSVTEASNTVSAVRVWSTPGREDFHAHGGRFQTKIISIASTDVISGGLLSIDEEKSLKTADQLERAAAQRLIQETMDDISGSLEIDAVGTENEELVRDLDIGDYLVVGDEVGVECGQDVYTGMFVVRDVHHRSNTRTGWTINVSVSQTIPPQDIEYDTVYYDPFHERSYDTFEAYHDDHPDIDADPLWLQAAEGTADTVGDGVDWVVGGGQDTADDIGDAIDDIL